MVRRSALLLVCTCPHLTHSCVWLCGSCILRFSAVSVHLHPLHLLLRRRLVARRRGDGRRTAARAPRHTLPPTHQKLCGKCGRVLWARVHCAQVHERVHCRCAGADGGRSGACALNPPALFFMFCPLCTLLFAVLLRCLVCWVGVAHALNFALFASFFLCVCVWCAVWCCNATVDGAVVLHR